MQPSKDFNDLIKLMAILRAECPWDKKQTNKSLIPYAIEETYELVEAINSEDEADIKQELGDVLLQVVFHSCLYAEQKNQNAGQGFDIGDVIYTLMEKLIRRHPHVFDKDNVSHNGVIDEDAVAKKWQEIKQQEKQAELARGKQPSLLSNIKAGSALMQAQDIQKKASKVGFDWDDVQGAKTKLKEELQELDEAIQKNNQDAIKDELGDCFFALVNVARKLKVDSETATLGTVHKFQKRFAYIEAQLAKQNSSLEEASLELMDSLWEQAKNHT